MKTNQYKFICSFYNNVFKNNEEKTDLISNPYINILKNHPYQLKYLDIYSNNDQDNLIINLISTFLIVIINFILRILDVIFSLFYKEEKIKLKKKFDIMVLSHYFGDVKNYKDQYFNNIFKYLKLKTAYFYIDHSKSIKKNKTKKLFISNKVGFYSNCVILKFQILRLIYFFKEYKKYKNIKQKKLILVIIKSILKRWTTENIKYCINFKDLIQKLSPKYFITTYEGNAHEKAFFKICKENLKLCCTIGYQHTFLTKDQNSLINNKTKSTIPNYIFTASKINKKILCNKNLINHKNIINIGKYKNKYNQNINLNKKKNICIVAPEGIKSEAILLIKCLTKWAKKIDYKFIIRLHPNLEKEKKYINKMIEDYKNIYISSNKLEEDLKVAKFGIYTGSSMVFKYCEYLVYPIFHYINDDYKVVNLAKVLKKSHYKEINNFKNLNIILNKRIDKKTLNKNYKAINNYFSNFEKKEFINFFKK